MSKVVRYLDGQSDIRLIKNERLASENTRTTDIFFLLDGSANLRINNQTYTMLPDDIVVVNKYESYSFSSDNEGFLFYFSISDLLMSQALEIEQIRFNCNSVEEPNKDYGVLRKIIINIIELLLFKNERTNFIHLSKIYQLLNELTSLFSEKTGTNISPDERIQQVKAAMKERYYENITLNEMAEIVHMDRAYFSKFFKKNTGTNFKDYLSNIRLQYALRDLIESDKAITKVAVDNGFFNVNGFNKKFKAQYQQTPSEYRNYHSISKQQIRTKGDENIKLSFEEYKENRIQDINHKKRVLEFSIKEHEAIPIRETWCSILNIGEAKIVRNSNLREHLSVLQKSLQFTYGRIWSVFTKKLLGESFQEFEILDEILDSLLNLGLIPWISINKIADEFKESEYELAIWSDVLENFCLHLVNRYGQQQLSNWKIEIISSNPEDSESISRYVHFYQNCYQICKAWIPEISIGGGSFVVTNNLKLRNLLYEKLGECDFDFYSFALFPYLSRHGREERNFQRVIDPNFFKKQIELLKKVGLDKPVYISEWSNTVSRSNLLNDSLYKGAFIVKNLIDIHDQVDGLGYWLGTDRTQKSPKSQGLLTGANGLISKNALFKPAMNAMKFFAQLKGLKLLLKGESNLICMSDEHEYFILGHNYTHPNSMYFVKDESQLQWDELSNFFEKTEYEEELVLSNIPNGEYELRIFSCLEGHGDILGQWEKFNYTKNLRPSDITYIQRVNTPIQSYEEIKVINNQVMIRKKVTSNEIYEINLKKRQKS